MQKCSIVRMRQDVSESAYYSFELIIVSFMESI